MVSKKYVDPVTLDDGENYGALGIDITGNTP